YVAVAARARHLPRRAIGRHLPASHCPRRLGGNVCHRHEPSPHRTTRWRPHLVFLLSGAPPHNQQGPMYPDAAARTLLESVVLLGGPPLVAGTPAPRDLRFQ